jgi:hypothetical protein
VSVKLYSVKDVSGQSIGPVFKREAWSWSIGSVDCPETSVTHYHFTLRNITEARRSNFYRGGDLKSYNFSNIFLLSGYVEGIKKIV